MYENLADQSFLGIQRGKSDQQIFCLRSNDGDLHYTLKSIWNFQKKKRLSGDHSCT